MAVSQSPITLASDTFCVIFIQPVDKEKKDNHISAVGMAKFGLRQPY